MWITFDPKKRDATPGERGTDFVDATKVFAGSVADIPDTWLACPEPRIVTFGLSRRPDGRRRVDADRGGAQDHLDEEGQ